MVQIKKCCLVETDPSIKEIISRMGEAENFIVEESTDNVIFITEESAKNIKSRVYKIMKKE